MRFHHWLGLFLLLLCYPSYSANITIEHKENRKVLFYSGPVKVGDARRMRYMLRNNRVDEVWLSSGGGVLIEGVKIGLILREYGTMVKIKKQHRCASACTVAFLGGVIRSVEPNGKYLVHAYSRYKDKLPTRKGESQAALKRRITSDPKAFLLQLSNEQMRSIAVMWASRLFVYYRLMIQPEPRAKRYTVIDSTEERNIKRALTRYGNKAYELYQTKILSNDIKRITKEGVSAAHEIAMRIERDAMKVMLTGLKNLEQQNYLKNRAPEAIRILSTMFESRILATSDLSLETLSEYGFTNVPFSQ